MKLCNLGIHEWGEWYESCLNKYQFIKEIHIERDCKHCEKREVVVLKKHDLDVLGAVDNLRLQYFNSCDSITDMNKDWEQLKKNTAKRNEKIYKIWLAGKKSMGEIGEDFKITRSRVSYIIKAMKEKLPLDSINNRVYTKVR